MLRSPFHFMSSPGEDRNYVARALTHARWRLRLAKGKDLSGAKDSRKQIEMLLSSDKAHSGSKSERFCHRTKCVKEGN
ncbi:hypothetical protein NDU88_004876 [Pleurodeles waltl]|uniref:Uncharacterized protein n=1 Tax=Pleurodeles waltl TaxID=8319 RepID=A0AAV7SK27_PLEWA|nr:hypothetical protein NDU88_004876 [Pleurodeles waltl]